MKIYEIGFDYVNYDVMFTFKINKDASFFFSKEELDRYFKKDRFYEEANLKRYVEGEVKILDVTLLDIYKDKYGTYEGLEKYVELIPDGKKSDIKDIIYLPGFGIKVILSKKAKEYIEKKYSGKLEYLKVNYDNKDFYIVTDIKDVEYCYDLKLPPNIIDVYDFSKVSGKNDIFKIGAIGRKDYFLEQFFCIENFKNYIEKSDLKGYKFKEMKDINDFDISKEEKKEEIQFPEIEDEGYYKSGKLKYTGTLWKGFRIKRWKSWHENGNLESDGEFSKKGEEEGEWKYYHKNGKIRNIANYKNGKLVGLVKNFNEDGKLYSTTYYEKDSNLTKWQFFYEDEKSIEKEGKAYDMGYEVEKRWEIIGEWKYYKKDGELEKIETYENGEIVKVEEFQ
ncbi:hypothetical protein EGX98_04395 [Fusobacterium necrophorum]|uniref:MORN repeat protein n=1 Tax=Fusobacterium necrophorum BL TaxID=1441732 RepID=A0AB73BWI4_9FUSO|nr:hypothetical protein [Fusobacterium necrophorum]AYZ73346.1 hypothetical protein EGX98_04395 [Fusobacterium necrophorum]AZW08656.1 hypothetical protein EO219_03020 [Fusobacterium necrophorum subsp. necrophorum]KDE62586.1 hypothetical protein FUSO3_07480 [Fusobacterium necrophorum BL]MBR8734823.1 hypothetical protein [Fusobacterium necrophorum]MBR8791046.1 hypothetical protein [Fusobacterium necrophorum]